MHPSPSPHQSIHPTPIDRISGLEFVCFVLEIMQPQISEMLNKCPLCSAEDHYPSPTYPPPIASTCVSLCMCVAYPLHKFDLILVPDNIIQYRLYCHPNHPLTHNH